MHSKPSYSAKDFAKTKSSIEVEMPERLIHRDVRAQFDEIFSRERSHGVAIVNVPAKTLSLTIGSLLPGQKTRRHRHNYETILFVTKGSGTTKIENEVIEWTAGDAVYVPVWAWHEHRNTGSESAEYIACENAPLLQNLGAAVREEAPDLQETEN